MAEENAVSAPSTEGDHANNDGQQAASENAQASQEGQSLESGSVDNQTPSASSAGQQTRQQHNFSRAQQRVLEKTVERLLGQSLSRFEERLSGMNPPAPQRTTETDEQPDYNNLSGWIKKQIAEGTQRELSKFQKEKLDGLNGKIEENLTMREARTFLLTQPEINGDREKMDEIREIIENDEILSLALDRSPIAVTKEAMSRWKKSRVNPNAPPKETLSSVTGGAVNAGKKGISTEELKKLQDIIVSNAPEEDKQAAYRRIEELMKVAP